MAVDPVARVLSRPGPWWSAVCGGDRPRRTGGWDRVVCAGGREVWSTGSQQVAAGRVSSLSPAETCFGVGIGRGWAALVFTWTCRLPGGFGGPFRGLLAP